jgi:hypothetical protein
MNSPEALLRFVQVVAPARVVLSCERFFTAPYVRCRRLVY